MALLVQKNLGILVAGPLKKYRFFLAASLIWSYSDLHKPLLGSGSAGLLHTVASLLGAIFFLSPYIFAGIATQQCKKKGNDNEMV